MHSVRHLLQPGTPSYAALKLAAVGGVVGVQLAVRRRGRARGEHPLEAPEASDTPSPSRPRPHPRSKKKRRSRSRR